MINGNPLPAFQSQMKYSVFGTRDLSHFEPEPGIQVGTRDQNRNPGPKLEPGTQIGTRNPIRNPEPKSEPGTRDPGPGTLKFWSERAKVLKTGIGQLYCHHFICEFSNVARRLEFAFYKRRVKTHTPR